MSSKSSWIAELDLVFNNNTNKTFVESQKHIGPLTIQKPFYPADNSCHVYILHPPGGVATNDNLNISVKTNNNAQVLLTGNGATKFYNSANHISYFEQNFIVKDNSCLEYLPLENIFFNGANVEINTSYKLYDTASMAHWEIFCLGREVSNERFEKGSIQNKIQITVNDKLIIFDNSIINKNYIDSISGLRGYNYFGTFIISNATKDIIADIKNMVDDESDYICGITNIENILIVRCLANKQRIIMSLFISIWKTMRPLVFNKNAVLPRIWAT